MKVISYDPDPRGLLSAREAVAGYYLGRKIPTDISSILLTSGTSEAYSLLFRLLCNPGEAVAVPRPSYPLFEYLAEINDVRLQYYDLRYDDGWELDSGSVRAAATGAKAIIIVSPHNPTGMMLSESGVRFISEEASRAGAAVIVDEVFIDYPLGDPPAHATIDSPNRGILFFTLNGISKSIALPQMKLGWIVIHGPDSEVTEASARLEILADTYLSVGTPVQLALPHLFRSCTAVRAEIRSRINANFNTLRQLSKGCSLSVLDSSGGWSAVIRAPKTTSDEQWALDLLTKAGVLVQPGYFYDFQDDAHLVVSLLINEVSFGKAVQKIIEAAGEH